MSLHYPTYKKHRLEPRIELAPLIDIIFVLLIFFAVSSSLILKNQGISLLLPKAKSVSTHKNELIVHIDQQRRIFFNKNAISHKGFNSELRDMIKQSPKLQVILRADRETPYHFVINVLDQIRLAGCYDIVLAAEKP
ncbi:MAG: biopolymer transporter ExbD [bacterium]